MTALVATETVLLVLLLVLVAGLLRSHAEILRRLGPEDETPSPLTVAPGAGAATPTAPVPLAALAGETPAGDAVQVALGAGSPPALLVFLSSGCSACASIWPELGDADALASLPGGTRLVVVSEGPEHESPARLAALAPAGVPVIMSSGAWSAFGVPGSPHAVYVREGAVAGEGSASTWAQLVALVADADADQRQTPPGGPRGARVDAILEAAGIGPDHPSLYPGGEERP